MGFPTIALTILFIKIVSPFISILLTSLLSNSVEYNPSPYYMIIVWTMIFYLIFSYKFTLTTTGIKVRSAFRVPTYLIEDLMEYLMSMKKHIPRLFYLFPFPLENIMKSPLSCCR